MASSEETAVDIPEEEEEEEEDQEEGMEEEGGGEDEAEGEEEAPADEDDDGAAAVPAVGAAAATAGLSRSASARSKKSVAWSTVDSQAELVSDDGNGEEEAPPQKEKLGAKIISGMWATRQMLKNPDPQLYVKVTLRELILYSIFMVVISYQTFAQYSQMNFTYTDMMKSLFAKQLDVTNMQRFWEFAENELLEGLYWETWYNKGKQFPDVRCPDGSWATEPCQVPPADRNVVYENRLLGLPRIRQLRVTGDSCEIHEDFQKAIKLCYAPYSEAFEDKDSFKPTFRNYTDEFAWQYRSEENLDGTSHTGQIATYSGAGSVQNFHYLKNETELIIAELKEGLWITQGTRFVVIDFTVYNVNVNLFCIAKLTFEFPATGGVIADQQFSTVKLIKYTDNIDYLLMATEIMFGVFIFYYCIEELLEIKATKMSYFKQMSNWMDLGVIGISAAQIFFAVYNTLTIDTLIADLLDQPFTYTDFSALGSRARTLQALMAFNVFAAWMKLFKYLSFNKTMTQLSQTLTQAARELSGFSVMFFIIYFAFVQLGYLLFGTQVRDFRTFVDSVYTLFRMILGDFNFRDIEKANTFLGPIFFLSYIFFVFFVLLNMFLAIINDTYGEVKADLKNATPDFQMSDFFKTGANNVKGWLGIHDRAVDVENAIKLAAADDGYVTYEELRENLRKARFADTEIDLFFYHFQNDPVISQIIIDEEELKAKEMAREKRRLSSRFGLEGDEDEDLGFVDDEDAPARPRSGLEARRMRSARIKSGMDPRKEDMVPDDDFYKLQNRVQTMEASIAPLATKIDLVLAQLGVSAEKKLNKSDMTKLFDEILQGDDGEEVKSQKLEDFVRSWETSRPGTSVTNVPSTSE